MTYSIPIDGPAAQKAVAMACPTIITAHRCELGSMRCCMMTGMTVSSCIVKRRSLCEAGQVHKILFGRESKPTTHLDPTWTRTVVLITCSSYPSSSSPSPSTPTSDLDPGLTLHSRLCCSLIRTSSCKSPIHRSTGRQNERC